MVVVLVVWIESALIGPPEHGHFPQLFDGTTFRDSITRLHRWSSKSLEFPSLPLSLQQFRFDYIASVLPSRQNPPRTLRQALATLRPHSLFRRFAP